MSYLKMDITKALKQLLHRDNRLAWKFMVLDSNGKMVSDANAGNDKLRAEWEIGKQKTLPRSRRLKPVATCANGFHSSPTVRDAADYAGGYHGALALVRVEGRMDYAYSNWRGTGAKHAHSRCTVLKAWDVRKDNYLSSVRRGELIDIASRCSDDNNRIIEELNNTYPRL